LQKDDFLEFNYSLYNSSGQLLNRQSGHTNTFYEFGDNGGILILHLVIEGQEYSKKVYLGK